MVTFFKCHLHNRSRQKGRSPMVLRWFSITQTRLKRTRLLYGLLILHFCKSSQFKHKPTILHLLQTDSLNQVVNHSARLQIYSGIPRISSSSNLNKLRQFSRNRPINHSSSSPSRLAFPSTKLLLKLSSSKINQPFHSSARVRVNLSSSNCQHLPHSSDRTRVNLTSNKHSQHFP